MPEVAVAIPDEQLAAFCRLWSVTELSLFGSVVTKDFGPESDIDVLVTFAEGVHWQLRDYLRMEAELAEIFGRRIDLVDREAVEESPNWVKRRAILSSLVTVYVAG
jgi:predicted nucleotidyltransferase